MDLGPIILAHEPDFSIGNVSVRPSARELVTAGSHTVLEPRVMQLLVALHHAQGAVVTKDDLIRSCWNGRIVGEDAISRVVSRLRQAARQDAGGQFRVETITRVGYRLAVEAAAGEPEPEPEPEGELAPSAMMERPERSRRAVLLGAGGVFLTACGALGVDLVRRDTLEGEAKALAEEAGRVMLLGNPDEDASAAGMLQRAALLEPDSATIQGQLALGYMRMLRTAAADQKAALRQRGLAAARRALDLDPDQPDAQAALLTITPIFRNWLAFEKAAAAPYRDHPDHLILCILHANLLAEVGRIAEILPACVKAAKRAPVHPDVQSYYALTLLELGRLEQGEAQLERCFGLWPRRMTVFTRRFNYLLYNHRAEEALRMIRDRGRLPTNLTAQDIALAEVKAAAIADGRPRQVEAALDRWEEAARQGIELAEDAIMFAANRGDLDRAFRLLDALYFGRGFTVPGSDSDRSTYFLFWRVMKPVRLDPRFALLTRSLGLDAYWQQSGSRRLVIA